jgi:predicted glycoside hydrolase/deacetylase ChbG (UPF0249 family)
VVIIHADDLGMCRAANQAFVEFVEAGLVSGSVMVPCPWFLELAEYAQNHPEADVGVHLTLTSEWSHYRWGPISSRDPGSGLLDPQGYLPRTVEELHAQLNPTAAVAEMRFQIERALDVGIDVTHIDTHMGAIAHGDLLEGYIALGREYEIPFLTAWFEPDELELLGLDTALASMLVDQRTRLESEGVPLVDHLGFIDWNDSEEGRAQVQRAFAELKPGLTHFFIHPCAPGMDVEAITDDAPHRISEYTIMLGDDFKQFLRRQGIHLVSYRDLRNLIRK